MSAVLGFILYFAGIFMGFMIGRYVFPITYKHVDIDGSVREVDERD